MVNRVLVAFNLVSVLFLTSGILMLIFALTGKRISDEEPTEDNVIQSILYRQSPLNGEFHDVPRFFRFMLSRNTTGEDMSTVI